MESSRYAIEATLNDIIREVAIACGEPDELANLKPSRVNRFHLFHTEICNRLVEESENDENVPPPTLGEMSSISSQQWKQISSNERASWNRKGQALREAEDLGDKRNNICGKCSKSFNRVRDLRHHEKNCGMQQVCNQCGKTFQDSISLARHSKRYTENYSCEKCEKIFSTKQSLQRHQATHDKMVVPCPDCEQMFKSEAIMKRHRKDIH